MKVSLVTVSCNAAPTLEETLRSVFDQAGVELEYLVVDGASRDGSAEIIRRHADRLAWWVSEPDAGQVDALNKGFARATGDILGFLNADDVLLPGALHRVCEAFAANPEADIVYGGIEWIDLEGRPQGAHHGRISSLEEILDICDVWWGGRQWVQPEVFFRRQLKERVGAFDPQYQLAFDYDFWVRCFLQGARPLSLKEALVRFRRHPGQKSNAFAQANREIRASARRHLAARPPLPFTARWRLRAALDYDCYQAAPPPRPAFAGALLRHPWWLLARAVRGRLFASLRLRTL